MSTLTQQEIDKKGISIAYEQALKSYNEGGIPIGGCLINNRTGEVYGSGHNQRMQKNSATLHGEIDTLENCGRLPAKVYAECTMYTTLSPCNMCTGSVLLYSIPRVVMGENKTFVGGEDLLKARGVELVNFDDAECYNLLQKFIKEKPHEWNEDIGVED
ncbi:Cytosine deaminase [Hanseniaspora vineae]